MSRQRSRVYISTATAGCLGGERWRKDDAVGVEIVISKIRTVDVEDTRLIILPKQWNDYVDANLDLRLRVDEQADSLTRSCSSLASRGRFPDTRMAS